MPSVWAGPCDAAIFAILPAWFSFYALGFGLGFATGGSL